MRNAARALLWLSAPLASIAFTASLQAAPTDPFAYTMQITPEDGSVPPAVEQRYTKAWAACQQKAETTPDNAQCFVAEFARQDAALNRTWKATLARLPVVEHEPLTIAQRKWVADRDPFCTAQSDQFSGGTIAPVVYVDCRVELTIRRAIWLEQLR
jgi:uncharacterized protein YecT (DUF1311 family)